jgi:hypothetical protein
MAKSSLARIEQASTDFLTTPVMKTESGRVGAFRIAATTVVDDRWASATESFSRYAGHLREGLKTAGIEPLAVIPHAFWKRIVEDSGLYDFRLENEPQIPLFTSWLRAEAPSTNAVGWGLFSLPGTVFTLLAVGLTDWFHFAWWGNALLAALLAVMTTAAILVSYGAFCFKVLDIHPDYPIATICAAIYLRNKDRREIMRRMVNKGASYCNQKVNIELPEPPADVQEVLRKSQNLPHVELRVTATADAISFSHTVDQIVATEIAQAAIDRQIEAARLREMARQDPIIYAVLGTAIAVIGQFGEFPIEDDVVERAISIETLNG